MKSLNNEEQRSGFALLSVPILSLEVMLAQAGSADQLVLG